MILVFILLLIVSFYLLAVVCDEFFVESLDIISDKLKLSSDVAGATFMAVGSSTPELFTSLFAILKSGSEDIGAGTIVGSAIFNILVIIGASALFRQAKLNWQPVVRDTLFYALAIVMLLFAFRDGQIVLSEAILFISMYGGYIVAVMNWRKIFPYQDFDSIEVLEEGTEKNKIAQFSKRLLGLVIPDCKKYPGRYLLTFGISIAIIGLLSYALVESAIALGAILHINPVIISLTVLAGGTSIPDLLSSMIVAKQGRGDMAIANAVGSNIFNIFICLGLPWMVVLLIKGGTVSVASDNLISSVFLLFATLLAVFFLLALREWKIGPNAGYLLIGVYLLYLGYQVWTVLA